MLDHQSYKLTSTWKIIEMLQNRRKYSRFNSESVANILRGLPTYVFAHAKVKRSVFYSKILKFVPNIGIILNYLQSSFFSIIKNWVWFTWEEISEFQELNFIISFQLRFRSENWISISRKKLSCVHIVCWTFLKWK